MAPRASRLDIPSNIAPTDLIAAISEAIKIGLPERSEVETATATPQVLARLSVRRDAETVNDEYRLVLKQMTTTLADHVNPMSVRDDLEPGLPGLVNAPRFWRLGGSASTSSVLDASHQSTTAHRL
jgi:hypothetical protein